jgi:hypothetical protein
MNQALEVRHCSFTEGIKENYLLLEWKYLRRMAFHCPCILGREVYPADLGYPKLEELSRWAGPTSAKVRIFPMTELPAMSRGKGVKLQADPRFSALRKLTLVISWFKI